MIRAGIITEDDPIELLDGWITHKMTKNPPHFVASELVRNSACSDPAGGWCVVSQKPARLATSMPEPDAMVIRAKARSYSERLPRAEDVALVVEVSDTSLSAIRSSRSQFTPKPAFPATGW